MNKRTFSVGALSDIGNVKETNQDRILVEIGEEALGDFGLFVVADGMGGLAAGGTASEMTINAIKKWWDERLSSFFVQDGINMNLIDKELHNLILEINNEVLSFGNKIGDKVGTTLSLIFIYRDEYIIKHIGDSRIYIINQGMKQITQDHSWVACQVKLGLMTLEEAKKHPKRNILTQCIGVSENIDLYESRSRLLTDDTFLLCSDGFYNFLEEFEISYAIYNYKLEKDGNLQTIVAKLLADVKARGAGDNVSVIAVCQNYKDKKENLIGKIKGILSSKNNKNTMSDYKTEDFYNKE